MYEIKKKIMILKEIAQSFIRIKLNIRGKTLRL